MESTQQQQQHPIRLQHQQKSSSAHRYHFSQPSQSQSQSQHQQRKHSHSHSPHHSRHTSPHSRHSHSLHSSPHQSQQQVGSSAGGGSGSGNVSVSFGAETPFSPARTSHTYHRPSTQSSSNHAHHHHHHRRRSRRLHSHHGNGNGGGGDSGNSSAHGHLGHHSQDRTPPRHHGSTCSRRHRSATDISSASLNTTCQDPLTCVDREVQEIFVRKSCCSSSRTELAQFFAEDLYGSSRRPSSCCTSSDYCYQTDSTSLYGSRSSLSRNNSAKSASLAMRKRRALHQRQPSYTSISLRGLNNSRPSSRQQPGSLGSVFDHERERDHDRDRSRSADAEECEITGSGKLVVSPSKVTIERQTSKDALSQDLPEYACSPSPIRWSFLADEKSQSEVDTWKSDESKHAEVTQSRKHYRQSKQQRVDGAWKKSQDERPSSSMAAGSSARKCRDSPFSCDFEESSTTVLFHQEGEAFNNCCNNYIQCNTYLDQDLQITSEDIHQYLSKGSQSSGDILNNSKNYPFQPSNALEFQYKNNFANNNTAAGTGSGSGAGTGTGTSTTFESSEGGDSVRTVTIGDGRFRRNSNKETNLNQNFGQELGGACAIMPPCSSTPLSPTNINLSSSTNNINIIFNTASTSTAGMERNANEVKFINTTRCNVSVSAEAHHAGYLPYTHPTYDYTNMSSNSIFDKPLGIDELPKELDSQEHKSSLEGAGAGCLQESSSDGQHSSPLLSPVRTGVSFESFDAPSDHNLISQRDSCQFSSPTPRSPLSPASPACSSVSTSINPASTSYVLESTHQQTQYYQQQHQHRHQHQHQHHYHQHQHQHHQHHHHHHSPVSTSHHRHQNQPSTSEYHRHHHHFTENFKITNAFKMVRKRARKYTDFLRKK